MSFAISSAERAKLCPMLVGMAPGQMALTRIFSGASSTARARTSALIPPLVALYTAWYNAP